MSKTKPETAAERAIREQVLALAQEERRTSLVVRVGMGRAIMSLQALRGDVKPNDNQPFYRPSRELVLKWAIEAGSDVTDVMLQYSTFIALRLTVDQVEMCNSKRMSFHQVYAMLAVFADRPQSALRKELCEIRSGKIKDFAKYSRMRAHVAGERLQEQVAKNQRHHDKGNGVDGARQYLVSVVWRGGEDEDTVENGMAALFGAAKRMGHPYNILAQRALERVGKA